MMQHILEFNWSTSSTSGRHFIDEHALDNSNIEKIIANKFRDPLLSSDDEELQHTAVDWNTVFETYHSQKMNKIYVPGLRSGPAYPKLSVLTGVQHFHCLKVLCAQHPHVLPEQQMRKPSPLDHRIFEVINEDYQKEQKEFIEWAKSLWLNQHCIRALRPKPLVENMYEAEFKVRAHRMSSYPTSFDMAAQIPLQSAKGQQYEAKMKETLVAVSPAELPIVQLPQQLDKGSNILKPCSVPDPCHKHPYQFILPSEHSVSMLPITEIHSELAQFAANNGTRFITSENALKCLVEFNRNWTIPVTVCTSYTPDGERCNVVVLDSEFSIHKEPAMTRTYRAFKHLLEIALIPSTEREKALQLYKAKKEKLNKNKKTSPSPKRPSPVVPEPEADSEDESVRLFIFEEDDDEDANESYLKEPDTDTNQNKENKQKRHFGMFGNSPSHKNQAIASGTITADDINDIIGVYSCTCTDTQFEVPPPRSFKKWHISNKVSGEFIDVIIHCSHKASLHKSMEIVIEPIPEYQLELGGSEQSPDRVRSTALSLMLRNNASVVTVRVDGTNGDMVRVDTTPAAEFIEQHKEKSADVMNVLHTALTELQELVPGHYVLQHESSHGTNALLYVARPNAVGFQLNFDSSQLVETDEAKTVKTPPTITPVLLPIHKSRKILPCAFTPHAQYLAKEGKKPPSKQKAPPQALKWPKKKNRKRKKKNKE